jgi:putative transposase
MSCSSSTSSFAWSLLAGVTAHPVVPWVTQQVRNLVATLEDQGRDFGYLVGDRDSKSVGPFDEVMRSVGAQVIKTPFRAPRANAFAERFVLTARGECLDWVLIRSERHAERALREFVAHYDHQHPHRGIDLEAPVPDLAVPQFESGGTVERVDRLGGLLHEYRLAARL